MDLPMHDDPPQLKNLELRVLEEYDPSYQTWVATCLETGTVATADDVTQLEASIRETLELEVSLAVKSDNWAGLLHRPASPDTVAKWLLVAGTTQVVKSNLTISLPTTPRREVQSEFRIAKSSKHRTA
jgi:hypothetical protein